jgi:hypothetical protein
MKFELNFNLIYPILVKMLPSHVHEDLLGFWHLFTLVSLNLK